MNPDVNITINLAGTSADVSALADTAAGSAVSGPPPEMDSYSQANTGDQTLLAAPGPEGSAQANAMAGGPPGPEDAISIASSNAEFAAPPPFEVQAAMTGSAISMAAPGPQDSSMATGSSLYDSAPAPKLDAHESTSASKKPSRKASSKKSRAKKKK